MSLVSVALLSAAIWGCKSAPPPIPEWPFEKDAIRIEIRADRDLNYHDDIPHTLLLCIYQVRETNAFNQLSRTEQGIYKLLECEPFDASVTTVKRLIVHPEEKTTLMLDRWSGTRHIGIVAGYFELDRNRITRVAHIPVITQEHGFFKRTRTAHPGHLDAILDLGAQRIQSLQRR
jgi:type VI secretion system VasD/TssJ family lipoprotein